MHRNLVCDRQLCQILRLFLHDRNTGAPQVGRIAGQRAARLRQQRRNAVQGARQSRRIGI